MLLGDQKRVEITFYLFFLNSVKDNEILKIVSKELVFLVAVINGLIYSLYWVQQQLLMLAVLKDCRIILLFFKLSAHFSCDKVTQVIIFCKIFMTNLIYIL